MMELQSHCADATQMRSLCSSVQMSAGPDRCMTPAWLHNSQQVVSSIACDHCDLVKHLQLMQELPLVRCGTRGALDTASDHWTSECHCTNVPILHVDTIGMEVRQDCVCCR